MLAGQSAALKYRGGRTLPDMAYRIFYYGSAWKDQGGFPEPNPHAVAKQEIDRAVAFAMNDPELNEALAQYFDGNKPTTTVLPSEIIDDDDRKCGPQVAFNEYDIQRVIHRLDATGRLDRTTLDRTAVNIVLPQGMTLEILGLDEQARAKDLAVSPLIPRDTPNYSSGIAGYHGSVALGDGREVLYSVVAWSDGSTGIPVPNWLGWENIAAILYHELQEIRTNPDVDLAVRSGETQLVGWNTDPIDGPDEVDCREIADLPLLCCRNSYHSAFVRVPVARDDGCSDPVPIQRMWSNKHDGMVPEPR